MELVEKAYTINADKLYEPWFACEAVYYGTRGQAKEKALVDHDASKNFLGEELTFLNIPIKRAPDADKYRTNTGEVKTLHWIKYDQEKKAYNAEIDQMVADNPNASVYVMKGGHYYRPDSCGYTGSTMDAGIYDIKHGAEIVKRCSLGDNMRLILIDPVDHNSRINNRISDLQSRLINRSVKTD